MTATNKTKIKITKCCKTCWHCGYTARTGDICRKDKSGKIIIPNHQIKDIQNHVCNDYLCIYHWPHYISEKTGLDPWEVFRRNRLAARWKLIDDNGDLFITNEHDRNFPKEFTLEEISKKTNVEIETLIRFARNLKCNNCAIPNWIDGDERVFMQDELKKVRDYINAESPVSETWAAIWDAHTRFEEEED